MFIILWWFRIVPLCWHICVYTTLCVTLWLFLVVLLLSVYMWGLLLTYVYTSQWRPRICGIGALQTYVVVLFFLTIILSHRVFLIRFLMRQNRTRIQRWCTLFSSLWFYPTEFFSKFFNETSWMVKIQRRVLWIWLSTFLHPPTTNHS